MDTLSYKTISANSKTVDKQWVIVDAEGKTLGRFCSEVAKILRGKNKTNYTPHVDCGDNVIVINCEKITLSGNKMDTKEYQNFSNFVDDSGGNVKFVEKEKEQNKSNLTADPLEEDQWAPTEAYTLAHDFRNKNGEDLTPQLVNQLLSDLNKIWRDREKKQI